MKNCTISSMSGFTGRNIIRTRKSKSSPPKSWKNPHHRSHPHRLHSVCGNHGHRLRGRCGRAIPDQFGVLLFVALAITGGVYGFVGFIVKMDDIGLHLAQDQYHKAMQKVGRAMIKGMPALLVALSYIGTAAMLWVGGGIIIHAIPVLHHEMQHLVHGLHLEGLAAWGLEASLSLIFGIVIGFFVVQIVERTKNTGLKKRLQPNNLYSIPCCTKVWVMIF